MLIRVAAKEIETGKASLDSLVYFIRGSLVSVVELLIARDIKSIDTLTKDIEYLGIISLDLGDVNVVKPNDWLDINISASVNIVLLVDLVLVL